MIADRTVVGFVVVGIVIRRRRHPRTRRRKSQLKTICRVRHVRMLGRESGQLGTESGGSFTLRSQLDVGNLFEEPVENQNFSSHRMPNAVTFAPITSTVRARCCRWCRWRRLRQRSCVQGEAYTGNGHDPERNYFPPEVGPSRFTPHPFRLRK